MFAIILAGYREALKGTGQVVSPRIQDKLLPSDAVGVFVHFDALSRPDRARPSS